MKLDTNLGGNNVLENKNETGPENTMDSVAYKESIEKNKYEEARDATNDGNPDDIFKNWDSESEDSSTETIAVNSNENTMPPSQKDEYMEQEGSETQEQTESEGSETTTLPENTNEDTNPPPSQGDE